jgi:hypothetical protein
MTNKQYKGFDITIYDKPDNTYAVDVNKPSCELLYGWEFAKSFNCAMIKAVNFIDGMVSRGVNPNG